MTSFRSKITRAVLSYFMLHETVEMYVNEIARRFNLDSGNVARKLNELEGQGILKSRNIGDQKHYSLNKDFPLIKEYKKIVLKTMGFESALRQAVIKVKGVERAIIFGSYARNKMDQSSDIDLLIIGNHNNILLQKEIAGLQKTVDREINIISLSMNEYKKKKDSDVFLKNVLEQDRVELV